MNTARNLESPTVTAPFETLNAASLTWCVELAQESCSNLYVLKGEDGNAVISLEAGTHGHLDVNIEYGEPVPYDDDIETMTIKAFAELEASGSHTVRWTSRGVRAYLNADWTRRYRGRQNDDEPAGFDAQACRPWYLQTIPDAPKAKKTPGGVGSWKGFTHPMQPRPCSPVSFAPDPWSDDELDAIGG